MQDIEKKILCYGLLSAEEQAEVEALARQDARYADLLSEARAFHQLLSHGGLYLEEEGSDDILAYLAVTSYIESNPGTAFTSVKEALETSIKADPALRERLQTYQERVRALTQTAQDPLAQFQALSGHVLEDVEADDWREDRPPVPPSRTGRLLRPGPAIAAVVVLFLLATAPLLFFHQRLVSFAALTPEDHLLDGYAALARNGLMDVNEMETNDLFIQGLAAIDAARQPCFLMRQCYDAHEASIGISFLNHAAERDDSSPLLRQKAGLIEAKVWLSQRDWRRAHAALMQADKEVGPHDDEVDRLLKFSARFARLRG